MEVKDATANMQDIKQQAGISSEPQLGQKVNISVRNFVALSEI